MASVAQPNLNSLHSHRTAVNDTIAPEDTLEDECQAAEDSSDISNESASDTVEQRRKAAAAAVKEDMVKLEQIFKEKGMRYRLIDRIGEGTFSTVYQAEDLIYESFDNNWERQSKFPEKWMSPSRSQDERSTTKRLVAVKKIYVTSSPIRIFNELELLHSLRGCASVCPLITAFRHQDQVVAILPHFPHQDFRLYYRSMGVYDIKMYLRSLLEALAAVHKHKIIHRDIKPTNFLYDIRKEKGVLVDFGLAEVGNNPRVHHACTRLMNPVKREGTDSSHCLCQDSPAARKAKLQTSYAYTHEPPHGYQKDDTRPPRRANRAGTRGFRAPEVLFKCPAQTTKIDIWSVGVILLTILAQRFPFFNSTDDVDALVEIATIFGRQKMKHCAMLHGTTFECSLGSIGEKGHPLPHIVQWSTSVARPEDEDDLEPDIREAVGFLELLLDLDPRRRLSARAALAHGFLAEDPYDTEADEMDVL